jgi:hypothetical protein
LAIGFYSATDIFLLVAEEAFKDSGGFTQKIRPFFLAVVVLFMPTFTTPIVYGYQD